MGNRTAAPPRWRRATAPALALAALLLFLAWPRDKPPQRALRVSTNRAAPDRGGPVADPAAHPAEPAAGTRGGEPDVAGPPDVAPKNRSIGDLIRALAHDDVRENATKAFHRLRALGREAVPALEQALDSADAQQRHFSAELLRRIEERNPSPRLLEVTVEGLRDDDIPSRAGQRPYVYNAMAGVDYLSLHADAAAALLVRALDSDDGQQRFLAAYVVARNARPWATGRVAAILIEHLEDNDVRNDASLACEALVRLGHAALPHLRAHRNAADDQQRALVAQLIEEIRNPSAAAKTRHARKDVLFDPGRKRRLVRIPTIPKRSRWRALQRVSRGEVRFAELDEVRRKYGDRLVVLETERSGTASVVEVGLNPFSNTSLTRVLLTLRLHYDGRIEQAIGAGRERRWLPVAARER